MSLLELAAEIHREEAGELPDDPDQRAEAIASRILQRRDVKLRSAQNAAARVVGVPTPSEYAAEADTADRETSRRRSRRRKRARRAVPRIRVAPASSFGAVFAQALGLVFLYWVIRSGAAVGTILDRIGSAVRWFIEPVGWGQRPDQ